MIEVLIFIIGMQVCQRLVYY